MRGRKHIPHPCNIWLEIEGTSGIDFPHPSAQKPPETVSEVETVKNFPGGAYLRHVGPTNLQFRIPFDVGIVLIHKLWCGHSLHPSYALLSCLNFFLGRTLDPPNNIMKLMSTSFFTDGKKHTSLLSPLTLELSRLPPPPRQNPKWNPDMHKTPTISLAHILKAKLLISLKR